MKVSKDGASIIIAGQGGPPITPTEGLYGKMTKISVADGTRAWTKTYSAGGTPELIYSTFRESLFGPNQARKAAHLCNFLYRRMLGPRSHGRRRLHARMRGRH